MWQNCSPFGKGPTTVANTCAPEVREWYHTRSPGENILGLKRGHDTLGVLSHGARTVHARCGPFPVFPGILPSGEAHNKPLWRVFPNACGWSPKAFG